MCGLVGCASLQEAQHAFRAAEEAAAAARLQMTAALEEGPSSPEIQEIERSGESRAEKSLVSNSTTDLGVSTTSPKDKPPPPPPQEMYAGLRNMSKGGFLVAIEGVDLDAEHELCGGTLLTWAAEYHRADLIEALLARGANRNKKSRAEQMTALEWAMKTPAGKSDKRRGAERKAAAIAALSKGGAPL